MADAANLRTVRVQYLVPDDRPVLLRDVRLQSLESTASPAGVRRLSAQTLEISKDAANVRSVRAQYLDDYRNPTNIRRVTVQMLTIEKYPVNIRDVRVQMAEAAASPPAIRRLSVMAMTLTRMPINVANVRMQYLEIDNSPPEFRIDAWPKLLKIINQNNGFAFTDAMLQHSTPEVSDDPRYWNTKLKVTATPLSGFSGEMYVYYQRYPIALALDRPGPLLDFTNADSVHDLIPQINAGYELALTTADIMDSPINKATNSFVVTVKPGSWMFIEGSSFSFANIADLAELYSVVDLNGFTIPFTPGGIINPKVGVNGIYDIVADNGSTFKAYVDMTTDGGYWVQVGNWVTMAPTPEDQMNFGEVVMTGNEIKGFTTDVVNRPVIPAGKILANKAKQWMLKHGNPSWKALFGDWQIGSIFPNGPIAVPYNVPVPVKTSIGNKNLYGHRGGWGMDTGATDPFGFWTVAGNGGPCGGAGAGGYNPMCPISDSTGNFGPHCDYTNTKELFIRATNYDS